MPAPSRFDDYTDDYDAALGLGLSVSGEGRDYFAQGRLEFLARCLREMNVAPAAALDFGCGDGASAPLLRTLVGARTIMGVDESPRSIAAARQKHAAGGATFTRLDEYAATSDFDLVYTNGVFHHIPVAQRAAAIGLIRDSLKPGGLFSFWDNNPWSLAARYVMSKIPFDRDAVMLSAREVRGLVREAGFRVLRTDYLFIFPAALRALRPAERALRRLPLGAQYQVLCAKVR